MYALDTNTLIYFFKGSGRVSKTLLEKPPTDIAIPAIVLYELKVGIKKASSSHARDNQLKEFTSIIQVLPFGPKEAEHAASIRAELESQGRPIGPYDTLIAATALARNATLVTHNLKEFQRIKNLSVEDWY